MQHNLNSTAPVSSLSVQSRSEFIWKCYAHVIGAILAFAGIEAYLFSSGIAERIGIPMLNSWMLVIIAFIAVSWGATHMAHRLESVAQQYAAFAVFVVAESLIFAPMWWMAMQMDPSGGMIESAGTVTLFGCGALIATVMITRKDFSFLRGILVWGFFVALGLIAFSMIFGWNLET